MRMRLAATAVLLACAAGAAMAQKVPTADVLSGMESTWNKTDSFSCNMNVYSRRGSKELNQSFRFQFKKPHLIRLKVLAEPNKGADVVYDARGNIRAAQRILGIRVKKGISRNDESVRSLRDVPFWEADMGTQIALIKSTLSAGESSAMRTVQNGEPQIVLTISYRGEDPKVHDGVHRYVRTFRLDGKSFFPIERTTTEDGVQVDRVIVTDVNLHPNLPESLFRL